MRLNYQTGTEGLPVFSLNCDRPYETIMSSMGGQMTDGIRPYALHRSL